MIIKETICLQGQEEAKLFTHVNHMIEKKKEYLHEEKLISSIEKQGQGITNYDYIKK